MAEREGQTSTTNTYLDLSWTRESALTTRLRLASLLGKCKQERAFYETKAFPVFLMVHPAKEKTALKIAFIESIP